MDNEIMELELTVIGTAVNKNFYYYNFIGDFSKIVTDYEVVNHEGNNLLVYFRADWEQVKELSELCNNNKDIEHFIILMRGNKENKRKQREEELDSCIMDKVFELNEELNDFETLKVGKWFVENARDRLEGCDLDNNEIKKECNTLTTIILMLEEIIKNYV